MHVISQTKIAFLRFWLTIFFCWKNPGGSIGKNGKLMGHVFCILGFFFLTESARKPCAEYRESNSRWFTIGEIRLQHIIVGAK